MSNLFYTPYGWWQFLKRWWRVGPIVSRTERCPRCGRKFSDWFVWTDDRKSEYCGYRYCYPCYRETREVIRELVIPSWFRPAPLGHEGER